MARWPNNKVSANGLADVLKAQGDLAGAAAQYRANMVHWPNDEVSANGLADVLKAQGDLAGAAVQYRANMARWPSNAVARHGFACVLRSQDEFAEALALLPEWESGQEATAERLYNQHLRGILLADLGRIPEARAALERGAQAAKVASYQDRFIGGLAYLALREKDFERVFATVDSSTRVFSLQVLRAHALAAAHRASEARVALGLLSQAAQGAAAKIQAVQSLEIGFAISAGCIKEASEAELQDIYNCEIELLLAA